MKTPKNLCMMNAIADSFNPFPVWWSYPLETVAVVAQARNRVIGDGEKLLWHLPGDLKRVKMLTMNKPLIMGRATYESIGKPLEGRGNIVMTRRTDYAPEGVIIAHNPEEAITEAVKWIEADPSRSREIVIFGGGEIYREFMDRIARIERTEVGIEVNGNASFPEINDAEWQEKAREDHDAEDDGTPAYSYVTLEREPAIALSESPKRW